jgi:IPT/TIG domain
VNQVNHGLRRRAITFGATLTLTLAIAEIAVAPAARALAPVVIVALPASGPIGTSVTITGTGFDDTSVATSVAFNGTAATSFTVDSNTQITAIVPVGATTGPVSVADAEGTGATLVDFVVTPSPPPVVALVDPSSGPAGTTVTITGVGYTGATSVTFNGTSAPFTVTSDVEIVATVPTGATTGPISVTTSGGTGTSATDFTVLPPTPHGRSVSLALRGSLVASGQVNAGGFAACEANVLVGIQRRDGRRWRLVERDVTRGSARYRTPVSDRSGVYRTVAPRRVVNGGQDVCLRAVSPLRRHR